MPPCSHQLESVDLQVRNLGERGPWTRQYQPVLPVSILPRIPAFTVQKGKASAKAAGLAPAHNEITESMVRVLAHSGLQNQVDAMESIYRKSVRQLEALAHSVCTHAE